MARRMIKVHGKQLNLSIKREEWNSWTSDQKADFLLEAQLETLDLFAKIREAGISPEEVALKRISFFDMDGNQMVGYRFTFKADGWSEDD